jgi:hypothetical protein
MRMNKLDLNMRYCSEDEVLIKRRKYMNLKFQFSMKLKFMRDLGTKLYNQERLRIWIDENFQDLYADPLLNKRFNPCDPTKSRNIELLLIKKSENYQKLAFKENIIAHFEELLLQKNLKRRKQQLKQIKDICNDNFRTKNVYLETQIMYDL